MKLGIAVMILTIFCFSSEKELQEMQKACDRKMPTACYEFGILYEEGLAVGKNIAKSMQYYGKACDYGLDKACQKLEQLELKNTK